MVLERPLKFRPYLKTVIWGGDRICQYKGIPQPQPNIGESWEISQLPGYESIVADGEFKGWDITQLIETFREKLLGKKVYEKYSGKFPLLIKFIDATDNLSVQVHPDDRLASLRHGLRGKTEMWYVIDAKPDAKIFSGLKMAITPLEYEKRVAENNFMETLAVHEAHPGDIFFLPPGRVHAIGAGTFLAEIQESSDITYRIYDYGRKDKDGKPRELHTQLAKEAIDFKVYPDYKSSPADPNVADLEIVSCEHFKTRRIFIDGEKNIDFDNSSFSVFICIEGDFKIIDSIGETSLKRGETILVPACIPSLRFVGKGTLLSTFC